MMTLLLLPALKFRVTMPEQDELRRARIFDVEWIEPDEAGVPAGDQRLPTCPFCGQVRPHLAGAPDPVTIVDAPAFGLHIRWRLLVQAFKCQTCGRRSRLSPPEVDLEAGMTVRCLAYLDRLAALRPFAHVADEIGLSPRRASEIAKAHWGKNTDRYGFPIPRYLGIDEVALNRPGDKRRNPPMRTVFTDLDSGQVLDMLEDAKQESVKGWLEGLWCEVKRRRDADPNAAEKPWIRAIVSDMKKEYAAAAAVAMPTVPFVIDRFHVHQRLCDALRPLLRPKNPRKALRKVDTEVDRLQRIVHDDDPDPPNLIQAVDPIQKAFDAFNAIYENAGEAMEAAAQMEEWAANLPPKIRERLEDFISTLQETPGLLDFFDMRITNARAEAVNSIIRVAYQTDYDVYTTYRELKQGPGGLELLRDKMRARARHRPASEFYCDGCFKLKPLAERHLSVTRMAFGSFLAEDTFDDEPYWLCHACMEKAGKAERCEGFPLGRKWPSEPSHEFDGDEAEQSCSFNLLAWARFNLTLPLKLRDDLTPSRDRIKNKEAEPKDLLTHPPAA